MSIHAKAQDLRKTFLENDSNESLASLRSVCYGLRLLRESRGLTQDEIGRMAKVPPASMSRYERALVLPNLETLHRILQALGVGFDELARASEEVRAAKGENREPDPILLQTPGHVDEDHVLAFFMARVQNGRGMEYIEQLETWASRLRNLYEVLKEYEEAQEDASGEPGTEAEVT